MGTNKAEGKLQKLLDKKEQLQAQIEDLRAREKARERKQETRKKILIGSVVLQMVERGEFEPGRLRRMMDRHLSRAQDRALFGLGSRSSGRG